MEIPRGTPAADLDIRGRTVHLTNLDKIFWPASKSPKSSGHTKRDLLQYYADLAPTLIGHLKDRAMVMKRYPNGIEGKFFFMKRAPSPRPEWIRTCSIEHASGNIIDFPIVDDLASLLWVVNLGCIDLNPWYGRCDDIDRPDYLHFDLDPQPPAGLDRVLETALRVKEMLDERKLPSHVKTTGSRGVHIYVPIVRGPLQKQVWTFAKAFAKEAETRFPDLVTAEYRIAKRPAGKVLVDYNQNAWGRTLASVYSVRPKPCAPVSTPVTWDEVASGFRMEDFRLDTVPARVAELGDLWKPICAQRGRVRLEKLL
jgi:bifunctional non-homologous end joining protein LigD